MLPELGWTERAARTARLRESGGGVVEAVAAAAFLAVLLLQQLELALHLPISFDLLFCL